MANIYRALTLDTISEGLQGCRVSDEALQSARAIAASRGEDVVLDDDDGYWMVDERGNVRSIGSSEATSLGLEVL